MHDVRHKLLYFALDLVAPLTVGYLLRRSGCVTREVMDRLTMVSLLTVAPATVLISVWGMDVAARLLWLPVIGLAMQAVAGGAGWLRAQRKFDGALDRGSFFIVSTLSNRGVVGALTVFIVFGEQGYAYTQLVMLFGTLTVYAVMFPAASYYYRAEHLEQGRAPGLRSVFLDRRQMPLVGLSLGVLLRVAGVTRPGAAADIFPWLIHLMAWLFIVPLGHSMQVRRMVRHWPAVSELILIKFLLTPLVVYFLARLAGLEGAVLATVVILSASPTAINAVVTVKVHRLNVDLAMAAFVLTTAAYLALVLPVVLVLRP